MADTDYLPVTDSESIPGHILTEPTAFTDWRLAQQRAARSFTQTLESSTIGLTAASHAVIMAKGAELVMQKQFDRGNPGFNYWAYSTDGLIYLAFICLSKKEPKGFTEGQAADIMLAHPEARDAVLRLWGYGRPLDRQSGKDATPASQTPATPVPAPTPSSDT
jgi:hypothetical protein